MKEKSSATDTKWRIIYKLTNTTNKTKLKIDSYVTFNKGILDVTNFS